MRRSLIPLTLALASAFPAVAEDQISLKNQDLLIGKVIALQDGVIELTSPHSETPLKVINKDLIQLNFAKTDTGDLQKNSQILNLRNGDRFPGQIHSLTETHLGFTTWFAGPLEIPRPLVNSVHFGVTPQRTLSRGPKNITDWTQENNGGWTIKDKVMTSSQASFIGKNLDLPESFIFGVNISWKNSPSLRIHLCSNQLKPTEKAQRNSYLLNLSSHSIEVKKIIPKKGTAAAEFTLITHPIKLQELSKKSIRLELRANRQNRTIQLYLDGIELGKGIDPKTPPTGTHVLFESLNTTRGNTLISDLIIQEWDASTQLQRPEPREHDARDTLSVEDGDRFSGSIINYDHTSTSAPFFTVQSPLSPDPIHIPLTHCSVMYFAEGETQPSQGDYQIDLRTGGQLTLSDIRLGEKKLTATHPWLGDLQIDRSIMQSISKGQ